MTLKIKDVEIDIQADVDVAVNGNQVIIKTKNCTSPSDPYNNLFWPPYKITWADLGGTS